MKNHIIATTLAIFTMFQINGKQVQSVKQPNIPTKQIAAANKAAKWKKLWAQTKEAFNPMSRDEQIQYQVNIILEWAGTKTKEELNQIKDTASLLNPRPEDSDIIFEAKKRAKEKLFPKSYWEQYAPQFMQNAVVSTKNYIYYLTPQFIKDRLYPTSSTITVIKQREGNTQTIMIKNPEQMTPQELKNALQFNVPQLPAKEASIFHYSQEPQQYENHKEKVE